MIGNQLATVIMRVWQVFHIIDGNLMKSENNQNNHVYIDIIIQRNIYLTCNIMFFSFVLNVRTMHSSAPKLVTLKLVKERERERETGDEVHF